MKVDIGKILKKLKGEEKEKEVVIALPPEAAVIEIKQALEEYKKRLKERQKIINVFYKHLGKV